MGVNLKKLIAIASLAVLAACGQAPADKAEGEATATEAAVAADSSPPIAPGVYDFTFANDWAPTVLTLNADGTYTETGEAIGEKTGTWEQKDGNLCKTGDEEECWVKTEQQESGAIVLTRNNVTGTLTPRAAAAEPAAAEAAADEAKVEGTLAAARALPSGTYSGSCRDAKIDGVMMSATCTQKNRLEKETTLDLTDCPIGHNVMNDDGNLVCREG